MLKLNDKNICTWRRVLATAFNIIMSTTLVKNVLYACTSVVHIPKLIAMVKLFSMLKILKQGKMVCKTTGFPSISVQS